MRLLFLLIPILAASAIAGPQPNILFIFCDDLGYGDVGVFHQNERKASEPSHQTPQIDALAKGGIQLRAHYCPAPVCAPSRASLFSGRHQGNSPIRNNQFDKEFPDQPSLGSVLQSNGYATALIGKWGLQGKGDNSVEWPAYPTKRGFDYFLGGVRHRDGHEHYPADKIHSKKKRVEVWEQDTEIGADLKNCYTTDLWTAGAKRWMINHQKNNSDKPFFLFLSYDTPHAATQIPTSAYPEGYGINGGLQWLGEPGKMINTAQGKPDSYIHPDYADKDWLNVYKRYASSVRRIDNCVGDLVQTLRDLKIDRETLVVFSSDHGPSNESYISEPFRANFFASFGPFTGIKRDVWEGGIRPGAIANWPGTIPAGVVNNSPSQMHDWLPTFCEISSTPTPALADGTSLLPTLTGKDEQAPTTVYVEYSVDGKTPNYQEFPPSKRDRKRKQMQSIRIGDFKAVRYNITSADQAFEVYNVVKDPAEANDIAGKNGVPTQEQWHTSVTRMHGTESSAERPYDNVLIPALSGINSTAGLSKTYSSAKSPYAYRLPKETDSIVAKGFYSDASTGNTQFTGFIDAPADGKYVFDVMSDGAVLRIHDIVVLDTDSTGSSNTLGAIHLKKGLHPLTLSVRHNDKPIAEPLLHWTLPEATQADDVPDDHLSH